jgi:hypothetical protein
LNMKKPRRRVSLTIFTARRARGSYIHHRERRNYMVRKWLLLIVILSWCQPLAWDGAQRDSCDCKTYRMQYHADSVSGGVDTVHVTFSVVGNADSSHWLNGTYTAGQLDSIVTALETGLNDSYSLTEFHFDVEANVVTNTAMNAFMYSCASNSWSEYKDVLPSMPYTSVNILGNTAAQPSGQYHGVYSASPDTIWDAAWLHVSGQPTNDWRVIRHELGHEFGLRHTHLYVTEIPSCASAGHEYPHNYWSSGIRDSMAWITNDVCEDTPPDPEFNVSTPWAADWNVDSCSGPNYFPWKTDSTTLYMTNLMSYGPSTTSGPDSLTLQQSALIRCYFETNAVWRKCVTWVE